MLTEGHSIVNIQVQKSVHRVMCLFILPVSEGIKSPVPLLIAGSICMHTPPNLRSHLVQECLSDSFKFYSLAFMLAVIKRASIQINRGQLTGASDKPLCV